SGLAAWPWAAWFTSTIMAAESAPRRPLRRGPPLSHPSEMRRREQTIIATGSYRPPAADNLPLWVGRTTMPNHPLLERADRAFAETRRLVAWAETARLSIAQFGQSGFEFAEEPPRQDQLSIARRHVTEAERHIANQQLALAKLDRGGYDDLAAN